MIPYVIDRQKRNNYITLFFVFTIASFTLGYYLGFQTAVIQSSPASVPASSTEAALKQEAEKSVVPVDEKPPVEKKDTASPAKTSVTTSAKVSTNKADQSAVKQVAAKKTRPVQQPVVQKTVVKKPEVKVAKSAAPAQPESSEITTKGIQSPVNTQSPLPSQSVASKDSTIPANTNPAPQSLTGTYSVQAGLFGSRKNALKYIEKLKAGGFDAYLNEYLASDGIMRYNVRFGYFPDRKSGENRLADFKTQFTTPAYLVINK